LDLSNYIEQLLFANDCVIIPNIGGFIVNYEAAKIDFVAQELIPPNKTVSFNPKLVNNDGLLANFLVQREQINYKKAAQKVEQWSTQIEQDLFNKKIVHFPKIGKLYFNSDSKLEFVPAPTNFLLEVYGMPSIDCHPILRNKEYLQKETIAATTSTETATAASTTAIVPIKRKKGLVLPFTLSPKLVGAAAVALLLFSSPYWLGGLFGDTPNQPSTLAEAETITTPAKTTIVEEQTPKEDSPAIQTSSTASILPIGGKESADTTPEESKPAETTVTTAPVVEAPPQKTVVTTTNTNTTYVVVLGAFGKKQNATRLSKKLAKDNYQALIELTDGGLHRVGVEISCNPSEFPTHFQFIKDNYNKKAWVVE
jgi:cell division septation protein DedD